MEIKLELTIEEVNVVLGLLNAQIGQFNSLMQKIQQQGEPQVPVQEQSDPVPEQEVEAPVNPTE